MPIQTSLPLLAQQAPAPAAAPAAAPATTAPATAAAPAATSGTTQPAGQPPAQPEGPNGIFGIPPLFFIMILMLVMMYFLTIRPEQKRRKELQARIAAMKPGDSVVTVGGIHGKIIQLKDSTVFIRIADNVKIEVDKVAIVNTSARDQVKTSPDADKDAKTTEAEVIG